MLGVFPLSPAYGRDYQTQVEVETAFRAGADFKCADGRYCSVRDFRGQTVSIRYNEYQMLTCLEIKET